MQLVDPETAELIYNEMGPGREISGGSAANTLAGMAALGMKCGFIGQVCDDQLGGVFTHDIRSLGIDYRTEPRSGEPSTARCLILVTPDAPRTMTTSLGAPQLLPASALNPATPAAGNVLDFAG